MKHIIAFATYLLVAAGSGSAFVPPATHKGIRTSGENDRSVEIQHVYRREHPSALRVTPVEQLDFETGEVINSFPSIRQAAKELGVHEKNISSVMSGRNKSVAASFGAVLAMMRCQSREM